MSTPESPQSRSRFLTQIVIVPLLCALIGGGAGVGAAEIQHESKDRCLAYYEEITKLADDRPGMKEFLRVHYQEDIENECGQAHDIPEK